MSNYQAQSAQQRRINSISIAGICLTLTSSRKTQQFSHQKANFRSKMSRKDEKEPGFAEVGNSKNLCRICKPPVTSVTMEASLQCFAVILGNVKPVGKAKTSASFYKLKCKMILCSRWLLYFDLTW